MQNIISVRIRAELLDQIDSISAKTNCSRNEIFNLLLKSSRDHEHRKAAHFAQLNSPAENLPGFYVRQMLQMLSVIIDGATTYSVMNCENRVLRIGIIIEHNVYIYIIIVGFILYVFAY